MNVKMMEFKFSTTPHNLGFSRRALWKRYVNVYVYVSGFTDKA